MKISFSKTITKPDIPKVEKMQFCTADARDFKHEGKKQRTADKNKILTLHIWPKSTNVFLFLFFWLERRKHRW